MYEHTLEFDLYLLWRKIYWPVKQCGLKGFPLILAITSYLDASILDESNFPHVSEYSSCNTGLVTTVMYGFKWETWEKLVFNQVLVFMICWLMILKSSDLLDWLQHPLLNLVDRKHTHSFIRGTILEFSCPRERLPTRIKSWFWNLSPHQ